MRGNPRLGVVEQSTSTVAHGGHVNGWDDPRMPTLVGARRRGFMPEGFRLFVDRIHSFAEKTGFKERDLQKPWQPGAPQMFLNDQESVFYGVMKKSLERVGSRALVVARRTGRPREYLPVVLGTLVSQTLLNLLALLLSGKLGETVGVMPTAPAMGADPKAETLRSELRRSLQGGNGDHPGGNTGNGTAAA